MKKKKVIQLDDTTTPTPMKKSKKYTKHQKKIEKWWTHYEASALAHAQKMIKFTENDNLDEQKKIMMRQIPEFNASEAAKLAYAFWLETKGGKNK